MRLYGKRSVLERIIKNPRSIKIIYIQEGFSRPEIEKFALKNKIRTEYLKRQRFLQLAGGVHTQGVMAEIEKFLYQDFDEIISNDRKNQPVLILLDRITDPQNLGSIIRTCACLGNFCVLLPRHESVGVTEAVLKVACGGENYVPVCLVTNLNIALQKAKKQGYWIGAAVVEKGESPRNTRLNFPFGLILGSEGKGIRPGLLKQADYKLTLPMQGAELSFNVAMTTGIFCYEIMTQLTGSLK